MKQLPKDKESHAINRQGLGIVDNAFSITGNWQYLPAVGSNVGIDCQLKLIENEEHTGFTFNVHVQSTRTIERLRNKRSKDFSVKIAVSTVNCLMNSADVCLLLLVNVLTSDVYFLPIRQYVEKNPDIKKKLSTEQETVNVRVPAENLVSERMEELQALVKQR